MYLFSHSIDGEPTRRRFEWKFWHVIAGSIASSLVVWMLVIAHGAQMHFAAAANRPLNRVTSEARRAERIATRQDFSPIAVFAQETPAQLGAVWVNTASGIYHYPGSHWYGRTAQGKYTSEADALREGGRAARNERRPTNFGAMAIPPRAPPQPISSVLPATAQLELGSSARPLSLKPTDATVLKGSPVVEQNEQLSVCIQAVAAQSDPAKLATLGSRAANPRLKRILYYLAAARDAGADPGTVIEQAQQANGSFGTPRAPLVEASLLRNLKICDGLKMLDPENRMALKRGNAPTVRRGPYTGQIAEVDHIVPLALAPEIGNELANLEMLPASLNRAKGAKVGERQLAMAEKFEAARLISEERLADLRAVYKPSGTAQYELPEP